MAAPPPFDCSEFLAPIHDDNPAGDYLRWEDDYAALQTAIFEEMDARSQGIYKRDLKKADWLAAIKLGTAILREKSKDLQVAAWVAEGLAVTRGLAGLRDGLNLVTAIQDAFWATAHPDSGDLELRMGVYEYLDDEKRFPLLMRRTSVTDVRGANRFTYLHYGESRHVEQEYTRKLESKRDDEQQDAESYLKAYLDEGKPRAETFDKAVEGTETSFYETLLAALNECKQALDRLNGSIRQGYDLLLPSPVSATSGIPSAGKGQLIVAAVGGLLHFRIFDADGNKVADTDERRMAEQAGPIEDLRRQLEALWPPHEPTRGERDGVVQAVLAILGQPPAERHYGAKGPKLSQTERALEEVIKLVSRFLQPRNVGQPEEPAEVETGPVAEADEGGEAETPDESEATVTAPEPRRKRVDRRVTDGAISGPEDALARIVEAAGVLRDADATDPTPYLVVRALRAGELYRQPKPLARANLPRPDGDDREELLRLATTAEAPAELLAGAERALACPENGAWLDVYRYALTALAGLGHESAERAASAQLGSVLRDHPEWPTTELCDGTPSASSETRAWLEERYPDALGRRGPGHAPPPPMPEPAAEPEASSSGDGSDGTERPRDPWDLALECVQNRQPPQAIALIARAVRDARTGRERFQRTLQQAELCLMLGRQPIAAPLLEGLARQIDERHLDDWEDPALCGRVLVAHYRCLRGQDDDRAAGVYRRLCQLDIAQALSLDEDTGG